jgi:hypothetical protein
MVLSSIIGVLATFGVLAMEFGVDTREGSTDERQPADLSA